MSKFPFVNLNTGKIYNCKKGSKIWWHEKGHIVFDRLEVTAKLKLTQNYIFWVWMLSTTLSIVDKYMLFLSIPLCLWYIGIEFYEEWWCNNYAKRKHLNIK